MIETKTKNEIVTDIKFYIADRGGRYPDWYVGVSKDAKDRMFNGHKVDQKKDLWIYRQAVSSAVAREVESHFANMLGTDGATDGATGGATGGGASGGEETADMVYAFRKNAHTEPAGDDGGVR